MTKQLLTGIILTISMIANFQVIAASIVTINIEIVKNNETKKKTEIVTIDGDKARLDFLGEAKKKTDQTPYLLTVDGGKSWILGNTYKGEYYCAAVDPMDFFKRIGTIVTNIVALVNPKVLDIKVDKIKQEPGPKMLGFSTTYVQLVTTAKAEASILFKKYKYTIKITDDLWYAPELEIQPFRKRWFEALTQSGYEKLDQMFIDWAKELPGPILKLGSEIVLTNVVKNESTIQKEKAQIVSVKEMKSSEIPKQTFAVPKCEKIKQKQLESTAKDLFREGRSSL